MLVTSLILSSVHESGGGKKKIPPLTEGLIFLFFSPCCSAELTKLLRKDFYRNTPVADIFGN